MKLWKGYWPRCGFFRTLQVGGLFVSKHWRGYFSVSLEYSTENGMGAIGKEGLTVFDRKLADCSLLHVLRGRFERVCLRLGKPIFTFIRQGKGREKYLAALEQGERNFLEERS